MQNYRVIKCCSLTSHHPGTSCRTPSGSCSSPEAAVSRDHGQTRDPCTWSKTEVLHPCNPASDKHPWSAHSPECQTTGGARSIKRSYHLHNQHIEYGAFLALLVHKLSDRAQNTWGHLFWRIPHFHCDLTYKKQK